MVNSLRRRPGLTGGVGYAVDQPLDARRHVEQRRRTDSTIAATGATLNLGDQSSSSTNAWSNAGTISATNSTVNLGGLFTLAALGHSTARAAR